MLTLCAPSVCKPLTLIVESCLDSGHFPGVYKNLLLIKIYQTVLLFPISGKLLEKLKFRNIISAHEMGSVLHCTKNEVFH